MRGEMEVGLLALSVTCGDSSSEGRVKTVEMTISVLTLPLPLGEVDATNGSRRRV